MRPIIAAALLFLASAFAGTGSAAAQAPDRGPGQAPDWCAASLALQANPQEAMVWRLHCAVEKLDEARAAAEDRATQAEVDRAAAEARLGAAEAELAALRKTTAAPGKPAPAQAGVRPKK